MRTMYDAVTPQNILKANSRPTLVAGYIDKIRLEPWSAADWALFPSALKVTIVKKASTNDGVVLDVEVGDATPEQAPGWAAMRRRSGFAHPVIYCNRSTWPLVKKAFADQGVEPPLYWIATATGKAEIPDGAIAAQYQLDVSPGIDISVVADYWPGVDDQNPMEGDVTFSPQDFVNQLMSNKLGLLGPNEERNDHWMAFSEWAAYVDKNASDAANNTKVIGQALNVFGAQIAQVFTAIDAKLNQIIEAQGGAPAGQTSADRITELVNDLKAVLATPPPALADRPEATQIAPPEGA